MAETFSAAEIQARLADHPAWTLGDDGQLHREYTFKNFKEAMMFANAVALHAETSDHHPDLLVYGYKRLRISVMSHDVQGITERDFRLLRAIDALPPFKA